MTWTPEELIALYMRAHYRLLARRDFWYQPRLQEGSKILCVRASELRLKLRRAA